MDWNEIVVQVIGLIVTALVPFLGALLGKLLFTIIGKLHNETLRKLAIDAVLYAEDKFGADTSSGMAKLDLAAEWLAKKAHISKESAEALIRAAYQNALAPFNPPVAPSA